MMMSSPLMSTFTFNIEGEHLKKNFDFPLSLRSFTRRVMPNFKVCKHENIIHIHDNLN